MSDIPRAVLSEHFQERMQGQRLVSAVFTTYKLEPGFFETEILPVFLDIPLSHASEIKLVQMEDALRSLPGRLAVYYDQHGLVADGGPAKLDVQRVPIRHATGIFHPKNVLALVEAEEPDETGSRPRALLCACASANLTRAGWWENVEAAHIEVIGERDLTSLRKPLQRYLDSLVVAAEGARISAGSRGLHGALNDIRAFLNGTAQTDHRSTNGQLRPQFHGIGESLPDFIEGAVGQALRGYCLEVISPYFDEAPSSAPLEAMVTRFRPSEVRVYLPRNDSGDALIAAELYEGIRARSEISWGQLPAELLRMGKTADARRRTVHAKVYRFFDPKRGGREVLYVGSANLTVPGFRLSGRGGNWESGFLVETTSSARPDWWLNVDARRPAAFEARDEAEGSAATGGTRLGIRFHWDTRVGHVHWSDAAVSPSLSVRHGGVEVLALSGLPQQTWKPLDTAGSQRLEEALRSTSLLEVIEDNGEPGLLLVQEEGMSHRPSLLLELSTADILRYWALLTVEQRAAFIEARVQVTSPDDPLMARLAPLVDEPTLFDRFAGVFHAFECMRDRVKGAMEEGRTREADYRLFGQKYDSLGNLLDRLLTDHGAAKGDRLEQYVVTLCARQVLRDLERAYPVYWKGHRDDVAVLDSKLESLAGLRSEIAKADNEMPLFLDWFEGWFLKRAAARVEDDTE